MKKIIAFFLLVTILAFTDTPQEKLYQVRLTVSGWQKNINTIEYTKGVIRNSNAPANVVLPLLDSLTVMQNEFINQLRPQLDTTKKK